MATTYTLISSVTVGAGGAANIEFTSIPADYTDLVLKASTRSDQTQIYNEINIKFNTSSANISTRFLEGNGSIANSYTSTSRVAVGVGASATSNTFSNFEIYIPNYAGSTNKSFSVDSVSENNGTDSWTDLVAGLWSNTAAITGITLYLNSSWVFNQYSTAYLYGISNA